MAVKRLPVITTQEGLLLYLKQFERKLNPLLARARTPKSVWNFKVTTKRGGLLLEWDILSGADGYEIQSSVNADFASPVVIPLRNSQQNSYFDALGGGPTTRFYKIRATAGTIRTPHTVKGKLSGIVSGTSIDSTDVATAETTVFDTTTDDASQVGTGREVFVLEELE